MRSEQDPAAIEWQVEINDLGEYLASRALKEAQIYEIQQAIEGVKTGYEIKGKYSLDEFLTEIEPLLQQIHDISAELSLEVIELGDNSD